MTRRAAFPRRYAPMLAALLALSACAPPPIAGIDVEGKLDVLGPTPDMVAAGLPGDWVIQGRAGAGRARVVERDGVPALRLVSGGEGFILARRTDALLLATPYLSWSWNMESHGEGLHPVRLIVGFHDGGPDGAPAETPTTRWPGGALPPHNRSFAAAWADSALRRGIMLRPETPDSPRAPLYIVRGGRENTNTWWLETIDLERIYRDLWPDGDIQRARVVFIGLAVVAQPETATAAAHVSGIRLSR